MRAHFAAALVFAAVLAAASAASAAGAGDAGADADADGGDARDPADVAADAPELVIEVARPASGSRVGGGHGLTLLTGRAIAFDRARDGVDVVVVVDVSESTLDAFGPAGDSAPEASWWRRVGAALTGRPLAPPVSVLDAELRVVRRLLERLDPRQSRVGVVAFAGDWDPHTADAWTEVALTSDFAQVRQGLDRLAQEGPAGATNAVAGIHRGLAELLGTASAVGQRRERSRRAILLVTDGLDVHPFYPDRGEALRVAASSVRRVLQADVRIDSVVVGENPLGEVGFPELAALETGGSYTEVGHSDELPQLFTRLDYTELRDVSVHNRTLEERAPTLLRHADGGFAALVRLSRGRNRIEVSASTSGGFRELESLDLYWDPDLDPEGDGAAMRPVEIAWRNRLLEEHLLSLHRPSEAETEPAPRGRTLEVVAGEDASGAESPPPAAAAPADP